MKKDDDKFSRIMFYISLLVVVYAYGAASVNYSLFPYNLVSKAFNNLRLTVNEVSNIVRSKPIYFLQPARYPGSGVTVNKLPADNSDLIFMSGFFDNDNGLRLIKRNGDIVAHWKALFSHLFPNPDFLDKPPSTDWNVDLHGAVILPDGSVVFNFEYSGLVKLNHCGKVVWTVPVMSHHSVVRAEHGGYWVPGRHAHQANTPSKFQPFVPPYDEDTIMRVSEDGKVLKEISVPALFYRSGLQSILTASGKTFMRGQSWSGNIVHLNKVAELSSRLAKAFPMFNAGDLLVSLREQNLIMVVDPDKEIIKWWRIGPWIRQHDPEFNANGTITVFNNNIYKSALGPGDRSELGIPRISDILAINPGDGQYKVIYGGTKQQQLLSVIRGKQDTTPGGGLMITEFEGGRAFETDSKGNIIWEYVNRYNDSMVAEMTEARLYSKDYFTISDWSCK